MAKWVYRIVKLACGNEETELNRLGLQEWELVAIDHDLVAYLKKMITPYAETIIVNNTTIDIRDLDERIKDVVRGALT